MTLDEIVRPLQDKIQITLLRQGNAGPAAARNRGAKAAKGEFLAFTNDDCQPLPNWLDRFAASLAITPTAMIGGKTLNALADNPFSSAFQKSIDYLHE